MRKSGATPPPDPEKAFLSGGGEMAGLIAAFDWSSTPLGPIWNWSASLRTIVSLILRSEVPIVTMMGEMGVMIYNDGYVGIAGGRHPWLLGTNVRDGWPEASDFNDNVMKVCLGGKTLGYRDQKFTLLRNGHPESVWLDLDYSPILDETGTPFGVMAIVVETTAKVAAERWRASEIDRQRQMLQQAPGFIAILSGPDHVFELTNANYMQLVGHRDLIGMPARRAFPDLEGQGYFELLDQVYESGEPFIGNGLLVSVQRLPDAPKEDRIVDLIYQPVRDPSGKVIGVFCQGMDVTARHRAERDLRRSEAQFRAFADSMPNHVWTATEEGLLDWCNPRLCAYAGMEEWELVGSRCASIVHPDDLPVAQAAWEGAVATGRIYEVEFRLRRSDGTWRWHLTRAVPFRDQDGVIVRWIGTNTDIDDQKRTAQALFESERRLQLSQGVAGIASLEVDVATGMVFGSDGLWDLWGIPGRDSVHISVLEGIVLPEDAKIRSNPRTRQDGSAAPSVEYRIRRPDTGEVRWLSRNIEFARNPNGKPVKMFGVMQDITDRKEAQQRREVLTHELEHRIKNILAMVSAIASQTLRNADVEVARVSFTERLRALANAHDLLNATRWTDASLREVVSKTIAALPYERISVAGPNLTINPKMALTLALAVNELGTNSLKYGALSVPGGNVAIDWSMEGAVLTWRWVETGGPVVAPPKRRGFGSFLIERVLGTDFGGKVQTDFRPEGVICVLTAPFSHDDVAPLPLV